jgi:hypothetical protein
LRIALVEIKDGVSVRCFLVEKIGEVIVLVRQYGVEFLLENLPIDQVHHANAATGSLILVSRTDASPCRSDLILSLQLLTPVIDHFVIRHDDLSAFTDHDFTRTAVHAFCGQIVDLL